MLFTNILIYGGLMHMKRFILHTVLLLVGAGCSHSAHAKKSAEKDAEFIEKHQLPDGQLKAELDAIFAHTRNPKKAFKHSDFVYLKKDHTHVMMHPQVPGLLIKYMPAGTKKVGLFTTRRNIGRIIVAKQIADLIEEQSLQNITVPQKWLYHIPGRRDDLDDNNYLVVAEKLDILDEETNALQWRGINTDQEAEIRLVIKETGFHDVLPENICFTADGQLAFIDTDPRWTPMLRNGVFRSIRKKLLGGKGARNLDDLLQQKTREVSEYHTQELRTLQALAHEAIDEQDLEAEGIFDIADVCAAALCDDECDIETADEVIDTLFNQVITRGGSDLTRFERCDDTVDGESLASTSFDLDEDEEVTAPCDNIDFTIPTRIILLEDHKPPRADPVSDELFTSGTQEFSVHDTLSLDCLSL